MGYKSRGVYSVNGCIGCDDNGSEWCDDCLGRTKDKKKKKSFKDVDNDRKAY